jgi:hypothetical protein
MSHSPRLKKISTMAGTAAAMIHVKIWKSSISGYLVKEEQRCQTKKTSILSYDNDHTHGPYPNHQLKTNDAWRLRIASPEHSERGLSLKSCRNIFDASFRARLRDARKIDYLLDRDTSAVLV